MSRVSYIDLVKLKTTMFSLSVPSLFWLEGRGIGLGSRNHQIMASQHGCYSDKYDHYCQIGNFTARFSKTGEFWTPCGGRCTSQFNSMVKTDNCVLWVPDNVTLVNVTFWIMWQYAADINLLILILIFWARFAFCDWYFGLFKQQYHFPIIQ